MTSTSQDSSQITCRPADPADAAAPPCGMAWIYEGLNAGGHQVYSCPRGDHKLITSRTADAHGLDCTPQCDEAAGAISVRHYMSRDELSSPGQLRPIVTGPC